MFMLLRVRVRTPKHSIRFFLPFALLYLLLLLPALLGVLAYVILLIIPMMGQEARRYLRVGYALLLLLPKTKGTRILVQEPGTNIKISID
jgi:hypothetical protein